MRERQRAQQKRKRRGENRRDHGDNSRRVNRRRAPEEDEGRDGHTATDKSTSEQKERDATNGSSSSRRPEGLLVAAAVAAGELPLVVLLAEGQRPAEILQRQEDRAHIVQRQRRSSLVTIDIVIAVAIVIALVSYGDQIIRLLFAEIFNELLDLLGEEELLLHHDVHALSVVDDVFLEVAQVFVGDALGRGGGEEIVLVLLVSWGRGIVDGLEGVDHMVREIAIEFLRQLGELSLEEIVLLEDLDGRELVRDVAVGGAGVLVVGGDRVGVHGAPRGRGGGGGGIGLGKEEQVQVVQDLQEILLVLVVESLDHVVQHAGLLVQTCSSHR